MGYYHAKTCGLKGLVKQACLCDSMILSLGVLAVVPPEESLPFNSGLGMVAINLHTKKWAYGLLLRSRSWGMISANIDSLCLGEPCLAHA